MEFNLKKILKALLLSTSEPLSIKDVQSVIKRYHEEAEKEEQAEAEQPEAPAKEGEERQEVFRDVMAQVPALLTATQIRDAMEEMSKELEEAGDVYRIVTGPTGYRIHVAPTFADWVRLMRDEPRPMRLSQPAMETLAIVAYRQPVTRAEMEAIRGVSVDSAISKLLELELVHVTGRADLPGRPIQYGTTDKFLEFTGVSSIDELPASDVLSRSQINEWLRQSEIDAGLSDQDMGLPDSEPQEQHVPKDDPDFDDEPEQQEQAEPVAAAEPDASEDPR